MEMMLMHILLKNKYLKHVTITFKCYKNLIKSVTNISVLQKKKTKERRFTKLSKLGLSKNKT